MYEHMTFESILEGMLEIIPDDIDKREGSVIYDALAPAAIELQIAYMKLDDVYKETFANTASRQYLIRRAREKGIIPKNAGKAILKMVSTPIDLELEIGSRFSLDDLNYRIIEKIQDGQYKVECEEAGTIGNNNFGFVIPIEYINGLESVEITELLIPGEDEEDTEVFRTRYFKGSDEKAYGGNQRDYINKSNSIGGVGATKVIPIWNGGGTVKLIILDSEFNPASQELIKKVQNEIDPRQDGRGAGMASIDHIVTVDTAKSILVNVNSKISFDNDYNFARVKADIVKVISAYLLGLRKSWESNDENNIIVKISQLNTRISLVKGVADIEGTTINGKAENLIIEAYSVPVDGEVVNNA